MTLLRYGYRGKDCRANVYLLPTGEIVYFIASVVVLFNYEERTQRHYLGHTDCVKWLVLFNIVLFFFLCSFFFNLGFIGNDFSWRAWNLRILWVFCRKYFKKKKGLKATKMVAVVSAAIKHFTYKSQLEPILLSQISYGHFLPACSIKYMWDTLDLQISEDDY